MKLLYLPNMFNDNFWCITIFDLCEEKLLTESKFKYIEKWTTFKKKFNQINNVIIIVHSSSMYFNVVYFNLFNLIYLGFLNIYTTIEHIMYD